MITNAFSSMMRLALDGHFEKASALHSKMLDLHPWLYVEGNPVGIKQAVEHLGIASADLRLPLVRMSNENKQRLHDEMLKLDGLG